MQLTPEDLREINEDLIRTIEGLEEQIKEIEEEMSEFAWTEGYGAKWCDKKFNEIEDLQSQIEALEGQIRDEETALPAPQPQNRTAA